MVRNLISEVELSSLKLSGDTTSCLSSVCISTICEALMAEHVHIYIYITLIIASDIQPHNSPRIGRLHSPECQTTSWSQAECNLFFSALLRHYLSILSLLLSPAVFDFNRFGHVRRRSREM